MASPLVIHIADKLTVTEAGLYAAFAEVAAYLGIGGGGGSGPPNTAAYFDASGNLTGNALLTVLPIDQFGRPQIRDLRVAAGNGAVWRQGAWEVDGDPENVTGEGIVIYGPAPNGLQDSSNGTFARVKSSRFGIRFIQGGTDIGYAWIADATSERFTDDTGAQSAEVVRATGVGTFRGVCTQRISIKESGGNAAAGVTPLGPGGAAVIANTSVTATSRIVPSFQPSAAPPVGVLYVSAIVPGVGFTLTSTVPGDVGQNVYWQIFEPAP